MDGTVTTLASVNVGTWEVLHREFDAFGKLEAQYGSTSTVINNSTRIFQGGYQDATTKLSLLGNRWYSDELQRFVTPGRAVLGRSPYTLNGNDPLNRGSKFDWGMIEGPDAYSDSWERMIGSAVHSAIGDRLAYATDTQLFAGTALFSASLVAGGWAGLTRIAGGALVSGGFTTLSYASLGFSSAKYSITGEGLDEVLIDAAGVGALSVAARTAGWLKSGILVADAAANAYQGIRDSSRSYNAFQNGDVVGGTLNAVGAVFGFAGAFGSARQLWNHFDTGLFHLTSRENAMKIWNSGKVGGKWGIYALPADQVPSSPLGRFLKTLVRGDLSSQIPIPSAVLNEFHAPPFFGPFSILRRLAGVRSTRLGSIDLINGKFIPNEIMVNGVFRQATTYEIFRYHAHKLALDYGVDIGIYAIPTVYYFQDQISQIFIPFFGGEEEGGK